MKVCNNPDCPFNGEPQPLDNFHRNERNRDGHREKCKVCANESSSRYYEPHPRLRVTPEHVEMMKVKIRQENLAAIAQKGRWPEESDAVAEG